MKRSSFFAAIAVLALSSMSAFADDTIRILCPTWPGFAPVHAARDLGYFKEEGLEVDIKFEDDRANVMAAMARGDIEADMRTVGEHQGRPRDESTPGVIIGTIDQSLGGDGIVADASINSAADLKGKVVAAELNIPARLILQLKLKEAGLTLADLQIKDIATADTVAVFADPSITAVATYEPYMSQAVKVSGRENAKILYSSKDTPGIITDIISVRRDDLAANPEKYRKFLRGIYRAIDYANKEPKKFAELVAPNFNLTGPEVEEILTGGVHYTPYEEAVEYLGPAGGTGKLHGIFDTIMQLNLENGAADNKLVATQQIDNSAIQNLFDGKPR
ncbi:MAG: ABC transporter substrate-binding protein [Rhizobiales bacterium]|nr:ABC transporter substrate-binding protein [Hyphomicrobiales bacterium]